MHTNNEPLHRRVPLVRAVVVAIAGLFLGMIPAVPAVAGDTGAVTTGDVTVQAISHKSPFNCGKRFYANNWIGSPDHNPKGSIDWQSYGGDAINRETVRATAGGRAYFHNTGSTSYGKWVEIYHSDGSRTRYAHLYSMVRSAGSSMAVNRGTKIGNVGESGGPTVPHLHYEQRYSGGSMDTSPTVEGITVYRGQKKAITSTNACSGSNPYTPKEVCGSAYDVIDSHALGTVGKVYLLYNNGNGYNCVVTLKFVKIGTASWVSAFLEPQGKTRSKDAGNFSYYAGPVKRYAAGVCVKWGGAVGGTDYTSPWEHCGS